MTWNVESMHSKYGAVADVCRGCNLRIFFLQRDQWWKFIRLHQRQASVARKQYYQVKRWKCLASRLKSMTRNVMITKLVRKCSDWSETSRQTSLAIDCCLCLSFVFQSLLWNDASREVNWANSVTWNIKHAVANSVDFCKRFCWRQGKERKKSKIQRIVNSLLCWWGTAVRWWT